MNVTMVENGLVPSTLAFGIIPRFPNFKTRIPQQIEWKETLKWAQAKMNSIIAELRVHKALLRNIFPAADKAYILGEEVLVYSETKKGLGLFEFVYV